MPTKTLLPTPAMITAGAKAGRKALNDYSSWQSSLVSDDLLNSTVAKVVAAACAAIPREALAQPTPPPAPPPKAQS